MCAVRLAAVFSAGWFTFGFWLVRTMPSGHIGSSVQVYSFNPQCFQLAGLSLRVGIGRIRAKSSSPMVVTNGALGGNTFSTPGFQLDIAGGGRLAAIASCSMES